MSASSSSVYANEPILTKFPWTLPLPIINIVNITKEKLIRYIYFLKTSKSDWSYVKKRNLAQFVVQEWRGMWQGSGWQLGGRRGPRAGSQITGSRSPNQKSFVVYKVQHMSQHTHSTIMALQVSTSLLLSTTVTQQF